jgi:hypothetical protein
LKLLKVGSLQKIFGLGTVVLHNLASTNNTPSGFSLSNIENPDMVYEYLKGAISKTTAV